MGRAQTAPFGRERRETCSLAQPGESQPLGFKASINALLGMVNFSLVYRRDLYVVQQLEICDIIGLYTPFDRGLAHEPEGLGGRLPPYTVAGGRERR